MLVHACVPACLPALLVLAKPLPPLAPARCRPPRTCSVQGRIWGWMEAWAQCGPPERHAACPGGLSGKCQATVGTMTKCLISFCNASQASFNFED